MEHHINHHPEVRSVLVIGTLRFQAALLVELKTTKQLSATERAEVIERLWPVIEEANQDCPRHAKIAKSHIFFTTPEKPMALAGKGTVQRQPTLKLYASEIDALYNDADKMNASLKTVQHTVDIKDINSIKSLLTQLIMPLSRSSTLQASDDFFIQGGIDSLQTLQLTRSLKSLLGIPDFGITTIYTNPSISSLANAIFELSTQSDAIKVVKEGTRRQALEGVLEEYKHLVDAVPISSTSSSGSSTKERIVVLTGSTGALGSYILQALLDSGAVSHVYCLNRSPDSQLLQLERSKARNLPVQFPKERVTFLTGDLSLDSLGLESDTYERIRSSATDIIHNAWPVNFNLSLSTFQPNLLGVIKLITLAAAAPKSPSVVFISSISSVASHQETPLPEVIVPNILAPLPMGYAESKYLAERILDYAASKIPSLVTSIARIGQVAGPANSNGQWNKHEWFPSLVVSSVYLGMIPDSLGSKDHSEVDWVPIDLLASVLVELTFNENLAKKQKGAIVVHPMNPRPTPWSSLIGVVTATASQISKRDIVHVPFTAWLERVRNEAEKLNMDQLEEMLEVNPAVKLLSFYEELAHGGEGMVADSTRAVRESTQLQKLNGIKPEWMEKWVRTWLEN